VSCTVLQCACLNSGPSGNFSFSLSFFYFNSAPGEDSQTDQAFPECLCLLRLL